MLSGKIFRVPFFYYLKQQDLQSQKRGGLNESLYIYLHINIYIYIYYKYIYIYVYYKDIYIYINYFLCPTDYPYRYQSYKAASSEPHLTPCNKVFTVTITVSRVDLVVAEGKLWLVAPIAHCLQKAYIFVLKKIIHIWVGLCFIHFYPLLSLFRTSVILTVGCQNICIDIIVC